MQEQTFSLYTGDGTFGIIMQLRLDMGWLYGCCP